MLIDQFASRNPIWRTTSTYVTEYVECSGSDLSSQQQHAFAIPAICCWLSEMDLSPQFHGVDLRQSGFTALEAE